MELLVVYSERIFSSNVLSEWVEMSKVLCPTY